MKQLMASLLGLTLISCSDHFTGPPSHGEVGVAVAAVSISGNSTAQAGPAAPVSGGPLALGVAAPTAEAAVERINNGLEGRAPPTQGNFNRALTNVKSNLPKARNVNSASGFDQIQLLAYAACSDLTAGATPLMQSQYGVQVNGAIAANQTALVNAGVRILDQHTAGIASRGPASAQVSSIFAALVQAQAANAANTSKMAFMAVCIAASTAGSTLLGM